MNLLIKFFLSAFLTFSQGEIAPIERKSCKLIEYIDNLYEHADLCVVIYYEKEAAYDCPLAMNTTRSIHVTHEVVMGWTAFSFQDRFECRKFLIGTSDPNVIEEFFTKRSTYPRFLPFTNIILFNSSSSEEIQLTLPQTRYSYYNGLYMFSAFFGRNGMFTLKNLLTNETMHGTEASIASVPFGALKHPLLNGRLYPREINITLFHCPPFVIINHDNVTNETTYDGVEYNLIESITEGWNRGIVQRGFGDPKISPWTQIVKDVQSGEANVALCSPWLNIKHYRVTDLSQSYDQQCLTFLVPRPRIVTAASYIYLPFSGKVWFAYIACLIGIALILHYFVNRDFIRSNDLSSLEVVFLEVINIATSHGATRFPRQVPIKILLTSWLAISLLLSTAYCTGYTSLLTTPRFTKPIDTIADFLDQGLSWSDRNKDDLLYSELKVSESQMIRNLAERYDINKNDPGHLDKIASGKYAKFVKILSNNYVTDTETYASHAHHLRLMKECFYKYYVVILFKKKSPYTVYFTYHLTKHHEVGLVAHWFTQTNIKHGKSNSEKFAPYSVIILLEFEQEEEPYELSKDQTNYIYYEALHVIQVYQSPGQISILNVLTGAETLGSPDMMPHITAVIQNRHMHPLIDSEFSRNEINVSLFNCPPSVIDKHLNDPTISNEESTLDVRRFDGFEFRLMAYITRKWKRRFYVRNLSNVTLDPWTSILRDTIELRSNLAMCGLWLDHDVLAHYDVSDPYTQQCVTFIVPRLAPIPRAQYVYLAFQENIWIFYIIIVVFISLLVYFFITFNTNYNIMVQSELFTNSVMQVLAIATQHNITKFPSRPSAKVLLISWFFFSVLLSAIYSTGYTTILTTSLFNKPINTIRDVLDRQLICGDAAGHLEFALSVSGNKEFAQLSELLIDLKSDQAEILFQSSNYGQVVSVLGKNLVGGAERFENVSSKYRLMNSCIYKMYTIFAFEKNSPYIELFNREIPKYVESGLILYWMNQMNIHYGKRYIYTLLVETKEMMHGPQVLSLDNIAIPLYGLGVGLAIATSVFIVELWYFYGKVAIKSAISAKR
ncbi:uncharacterized protein DMENIID0001_057390 [Sergentomyia squamirostris]